MSAPIPGLTGGVIFHPDAEFDRATHGLSPLSAAQEAAMEAGARHLYSLDARGLLDLERAHQRGLANWCEQQIQIAKRRIAEPLTSRDVEWFQQRVHTLLAQMQAVEQAEIAAIVAMRELDWRVAA